MRYYFIFIFYLFAACASLSAQGGQYIYGANAAESAEDVLPMANGDLVLAGYTTSFNAEEGDAHVVRVNTTGDTLWSRQFGNSFFTEIATTLVALEEGFLIAGTAFNGIESHIFAVQFSEAGDLEWGYYSEEDSVTCVAAVQLPDNSFALLGTKTIMEGTNGTAKKDFYLSFINTDGTPNGQRTYDLSGTEIATDMVCTSDGICLLGTTNSFTSTEDLLLIQTDFQGELIWSEHHDWTGYDDLPQEIILIEEGFAIAGSVTVPNSGNEDVALWEISSTGELTNFSTHHLGANARANALAQNAVGDYFITGNRSGVNAAQDAFLAKVNADNTLDWWRSYGGMYTDRGNAIIPFLDGWAIAGMTRNFGALSSDMYLILTDEEGHLFTNFLSGKVFEDTNENNEFDTLETGISDWIIAAYGATTQYTSTDEFGNYSIALDTGAYTVELLFPNDYWEAYMNDTSFVIDDIGTIISKDFPVTAAIDCPSLHVDIATPFLRIGYESNYYISYCNEGTITAENAALSLDLDAFFNYTSSSLSPSTINGAALTYDLGDIAPFECGNFVLTVVVDTSAVAGQTHCLEAHITPDIFCETSSTAWDGSSIEVEGTCVDGAAIFTISNNTANEMVEAVDFVIIEDHVMTLTQPIQLPALADSLFVFNPEGSTIRMEVEQSPGHPGYDYPSVVIEGCGGAITPSIVNEFPLNDANPFVEIDCRENISSYDPNDKQAFPTGYREEHFIEPNIDIEYLIRFQNTGTDTAFLVVLKDTLSQWLDAGTVRPGASSHPYEFDISGEGILTFTFANIELPDSTTNEVASNGFVKFRIAQNAKNPIGALIENNAAIYFDFNTPVITNTTFHQVGVDFIEVSIDSPTNVSREVDEMPLKVYPNPSKEIAIFELQSIDNQGFNFQLFNTSGQVLRMEQHIGNSFVFHRSGLENGIYFYQIQPKNAPIITGKIILK